MSRHNFRRLPSVLGAISLPQLTALLAPHREFFGSKGLVLDDRKEHFDYEALLAILVDHRSGTPEELLESIEMIGEMASPESMDVLLEEAATRGLEITGFPDPTPADVAAQVLAAAPDLFAREYVNCASASSRRYFYFQASPDDPGETVAPPADLPARLTRALDEQLSARRRGCGARVSAYPNGDRIEYLIRRGGYCQRLPVVREGQRTSVVVRPERYDVLNYDPAAREIAISADGENEVKFYREILGRELFGNPRAFKNRERFDLSPLRTAGQKALACGDIDGIRGVALTELSWRESGDKSVRSQKGNDLFRETRGLGRSLRNATLLGATFSMALGRRAVPKNVTIRPTNVAEFPNSADTSLLDEWLTRRGFMSARSRHASGSPKGLARC
jgi:hypothetical protein